MTNQILMRISLFSGAGQRTPFLSASENRQTLSSYANTLLDMALREQLEQELLLMKRGENLNPNRRRRDVIRRYLAAEPYRVIRGFYTAQMNLISGGTEGAGASPTPFYQDIIHQKQTSITHTSYEQHNTAIIQQDAKEPSNQKAAQQLADQVFRRVERKLRMERERLGRFF